MYFLFAIGTISILLGSYVIIRNPNQNLNRLFFLLSFFSTLWIFANLGTGIFESHFWIKSAYAFGSLATASAFLWVLYLVRGEKSLRYMYLVIILGLIFFIIPYTDGLILKDIRSVSLGKFEGDFGVLFPVYTAYQFGLLLIQIIVTFIAFRQSGACLCSSIR
jgi:hypothetical protein